MSKTSTSKVATEAETNEPVGSSISQEQEQVMAAGVEAPEAEKPKEEPVKVFSLDAIRASFGLRLQQNKGSIQTLLAEIPSLVASSRISNETAEELRNWLDERKNSLSENEKIREDILDRTSGYQPLRSVVEASVDARETIAQANSLGNELDGTILTRLTFDMADILYGALKEGKIKISPTIADNLITYCKENKLLGNEEEVKDTSSLAVVESETQEEGKEEPTIVSKTSGAIVDMVSPYRGRSNARMVNNIKQASIRACLLVYGKTSRVTTGYIRKSDCSGKRFTKEMVFLYRDQVEGEPNGDYYRAVCVPSNMVAPTKYRPEFDADLKEYRLIPTTPNDSNALRYLVEDWAMALYNHHYGSEALTFDLGPTKGKFPTGLLLRKAPEERSSSVPVAKKSDEPVALVDWLKAAKAPDAVIKEAQEQRNLAVGGGEPSSANFAAIIKAIDELIVSKDVADFPPASLAMVARLFRHTFHARISKYIGKVLPAEVGRELVAISREIEPFFVWNDEAGCYLWVDHNGTSYGTFGNGKTDNKVAAA